MRQVLRSALSLAALLATASPAFAHELPSEAANKKVVLDFYRALDDAGAAGALADRIKSIAETYISPDYVQHAEAFANLPGPGTPRDRLVRMFQSLPPMKMPPAKTIAVMAEGDRVMLLTARETPQGAGAAKPSYIFNMFRLKAGRLVEHWDVQQGGAPGGPPPPGADGPAVGPGMAPPPRQ